MNELRRTASEVLGTLPHPMDLQWDVLATKGLTEERRRRIAEYLTAATSSMPASAIIAATVWVALGAPELPTDF